MKNFLRCLCCVSLIIAMLYMTGCSDILNMFNRNSSEEATEEEVKDEIIEKEPDVIIKNEEEAENEAGESEPAEVNETDDAVELPAVENSEQAEQIEQAEQNELTPPELNVSVGSIPYPGKPVQQGQFNENVLLMQKYLNAISSVQTDIPQLTEDGAFGPATYNAVQIFQRLYGLTVDGSIGPITWEKIVTTYDNLQ